MVWWISLIASSILIPIINYLFSVLDIHRPINWFILPIPILVLNSILWWIFQSQKGYSVVWFSSFGITTLTAIMISILLSNNDMNNIKIIIGIVFVIVGVFILNWR